MAETRDRVEIASVAAQPSTRSYDTEYDRGPLLPGLALRLTLRNPHARRTTYVVTDRAALAYDSETATLTVRVDLPTFASSGHTRIYPCVDPIQAKAERDVSLWIPLRFQDLRRGQPGTHGYVDATGWQHLVLSVAAGASPVHPQTATAERPDDDGPRWPTVQRTFSRAELLGSDEATKEEP